MKRWHDGLLWTGLFILLTAGPLQAHGLRLFAAFDGSEAAGSVYFVGGGVFPAAPVEVRDQEGAVVARFTADAEGRFRFRPSAAGVYQLSVDSGDGHRAEFRLSVPAAGQAAGQTESGGATIAPVPVEMAEGSAGAFSPAQTALLEQAVARQLAPLREEIAAYESKVRLHDILGGIGYILGVFGLLSLILARRRRKE